MVLKILRSKKVLKRVMFVCACLIVPAFVLWGVGSAVRNKKNMPYAGTIFGRKVEFAEFVDAWQKSRDFAIKQFGDNISSDFVDEIAWNRLILLDEAKRRKISATDAEVAAVITRMPQFRHNGKFDAQYYQQLMGLRLRKFEELMKEDITIAKLKQEIIEGTDISDEELLEKYKDKNRKATASIIYIDPAKYQAQITVNDDEIKDFYAGNKNSFRTQPQIDLRYIFLSTEMLQQGVEISQEEIEDYYNFNKDRYIIEPSEDSTVTATEDETAETDETGQDLMPDADAAKLELLNQDTTAEKPAETPVEEVQYKSIEEVKEEITKELKDEKVEARTKAMVRKIEDNLYENFDLDKLAKEFSLKIDETGFFSKNQPIPNIGFSFPVAQAAFSLEQINDISDMIKTPEGYYVVQLKEKKAPYIPELEEIKDEVKLMLIQSKAKNIAKDKAESYLKDIKAMIKDGKTFEEAAASLELEVTPTKAFTINGYIPQLGPSKEISKMISSMKKDAISEVISTEKGSFILKLTDIIEIDMDLFEKDKADFKQTLLESLYAEKYNKWFESLKKEANLTLNEIKENDEEEE